MLLTKQAKEVGNIVEREVGFIDENACQRDISEAIDGNGGKTAF